MRKPLVLAAIAAAVFACSDSTGPSVYLNPGMILAPAVDTINISDTLHVSFAVLDIRGDTIGGSPASAKSLDSTTVSVINDSTWYAKKVGSTTVSLFALDTLGVVIPGVEADVFVEVIPDQIATLTLSTTLDSLAIAATVTLTATETDSLGNASAGHTITWLSSNKQVATVSSAGKVTAIAAGTVTITAVTDSGFSATATIVVKPAVTTTSRRRGGGL